MDESKIISIQPRPRSRRNRGYEVRRTLKGTEAIALPLLAELAGLTIGELDATFNHMVLGLDRRHLFELVFSRHDWEKYLLLAYSLLQRRFDDQCRLHPELIDTEELFFYSPAGSRVMSATNLEVGDERVLEDENVFLISGTISIYLLAREDLQRYYLGFWGQVNREKELLIGFGEHYVAPTEPTVRHIHSSHQYGVNYDGDTIRLSIKDVGWMVAQL